MNLTSITDEHEVYLKHFMILLQLDFTMILINH